MIESLTRTTPNHHALTPESHGQAVTLAAALAEPCRRCPVRETSVCHLMTSQDVERLFPDGPRVRRLKAAATLFHQGDPLHSLFIVRRGWMFTYKMFEDGKRQIIRFVLPGDLLGFEGNEAQGLSCSAEAVTDVEFCRVPLAAFFRTCTASPQLAMTYASALTREVLAAWNYVGALGQQDAAGRVANLLLELYRRAAARPDAAVAGAAGTGSMQTGLDASVAVPINQTHIADATGLTSVHVCRTLKQMRALNLLEFQKGRLAVLDPERLAETAQLDAAQAAGQEYGRWVS